MISGVFGIVVPITIASTTFTVPAISPFIPATCIGSAKETLRVRLLSIAQKKHAPQMHSAPHGTASSRCGSQESKTPPPRMAIIPVKIRRSKFSLKTNHASNAVSTPSRFRSNDAEEAEVTVRPNISRTGATMPPDRTAEPSHGRSGRPNRASRLFFPLRSPRNQSKQPIQDPIQDTKARPRAMD